MRGNLIASLGEEGEIIELIITPKDKKDTDAYWNTEVITTIVGRVNKRN